MKELLLLLIILECFIIGGGVYGKIVGAFLLPHGGEALDPTVFDGNATQVRPTHAHHTYSPQI